MKLIRFGAPQQEKPGVVAGDGSWRDVTAFTSDYNTDFLESDGAARLSEWLAGQGGRCRKSRNRPAWDHPSRMPERSSASA